MNRLLFTACLLNIIVFYSECGNGCQRYKFLFNSNWQFTRLNEVNLNNNEINNQRTDWPSQYNVKHISSSLDLDIPEEMIKAEFRQHIIEINGLFQQRDIDDEKTFSNNVISLSLGEAKQTKQIIEIENPNLWSPDAPCQYLLRTEVAHNGEILHMEEQRIGIHARAIIEVEPVGFEFRHIALDTAGFS